jgi:hypothetical protein
MHLVVFDIDGTLTNTNLEDGELQWRFWLCRPQLQRRMFVGYVLGGTLVYRRMCCDAEHRRFMSMGVWEGAAPVTLGAVARISFIRDPDGNFIEISQRASLTGPIPA